MKKLLLLLTSVLCTLSTWAENVASVTIGSTTTEYEDLSSAFAAANVADQTSTLELLSDCTVTGSSGAFATLTAGNITIDFNGKTLTSTGYNKALYINGANVTLSDSSTDGNGGITATESNKMADAVYYESGNLTINGGKFDGNHYSLCFSSNASNPITLHGGTFVQTGYYAIYSPDKALLDLVNTDSYYYADTEGNEITLVSSQSVINKTVTLKEATDANAVASVTMNGTTNKYISLASAFLASKKGTTDVPATLTLLQDYTSNAAIDLTSGTFTMDLNSKTITFSGKNCKFNIYGANVTITDNSADKTGAIAGTDGVAIQANNSGSLTIYEGTFTGAKEYAGLDVIGNITVTLYGGRYITGEGSSQASGINTPTTGTNILASGYYYWDNANNILDYEKTPGHIVYDNNTLALDIKVAQLTSENAYASVTIDGEVTNYTSFAKAVAAAAVDGTTATIKVLRDAYSNAVAFTAGTVTLDLNGNSLSNSVLSTPEIIKVSDNATLTITDNTEHKNGSIVHTSSNSGTYNAINFTGGHLSINAGTFSAGTCALYAEEASATETALINLTGGYFKTTTSWGSSIIVPSTTSATMMTPTVNWDIINMDGYYFKDDEGDPVVPYTYNNDLDDNVTVTTVPTTPVDVTLDENTTDQYSLPTIVTTFNYNVTMKRSMTSGKWNSVCLPFSMTADEIKTAFGTDTKIMHIKDITSDDVVEFEDATYIDANEFYIVKPTTTFTKFTLESRKVKTLDGGFVKTFDSGYSIYSPFTKRVINGMPEEYGGYYVLSNNKLCRIAYSENMEDGVTIKGFRWYIAIMTSSPYGSSKELTSNIDLSDISTSVQSITTDSDSNVPAYNLAGQRINSNAKGIVIKKGKKIIVK